jgi:teichuronic acid biosynthesis glycosyltransferase TuaC
VSNPAILIVLGAYFPEISGGGLQARELIRVLRDRLRFTVLTTSSVADAADRVDGIDVVRVLVDIGSRWSIMRALGRGLRRLVSLRRSFDVMHLEGFTRKNIPLTLAAAILRKPIVLTLHTGAHDDVRRIKARSRLGFWSITRARRVIAVSPALRDAATEAGVPPEQVQYLPNGVDVTRFSPADPRVRADLRRRLGIPAETRAILFVGFFSHEKGPQRLFAAWRGLPPELRQASTLVFVGQTTLPHGEVDARLADDIRREAAAAGATPIFVERTHEIEQYYRAADLFVLASTREGCPVALLEAMASGLPVISTHLPGATDMIVVDGMNGRLVPAGDIDRLREALARMLTDADGARTMGGRARETVEKTFSVDQTAHAYLEIYRAVSQ